MTNELKDKVELVGASCETWTSDLNDKNMY